MLLLLTHHRDELIHSSSPIYNSTLSTLSAALLTKLEHKTEGVISELCSSSTLWKCGTLFSLHHCLCLKNDSDLLKSWWQILHCWFLLSMFSCLLCKILDKYILWHTLNLWTFLLLSNHLKMPYRISLEVELFIRLIALIMTIIRLALLLNCGTWNFIFKLVSSNLHWPRKSATYIFAHFDVSLKW